jgi:NADPH:quinone reductase-like Zn-dependent oxidoreductase
MEKSSWLMVFLLKLLPGGKQTPLSPNLAEYAPAHLDWYHDTLTELFGLLAEDKIEPLVAARFPLAEAAHAHERLERGGYAGKVVLVTGAYCQSREREGRKKTTDGG